MSQRLFTTLSSLDVAVDSALIDESLGFHSSFKPTSIVPGTDCGSDIFFKIARAKKVDPQVLGESLLPKLDDPRFSVAHGFLNFFDDTHSEWLLTPEVTVPDAAQLPAIFGVFAPDFQKFPADHFCRVRIASLMLFSVWLALKFKPSAQILDGGTTIPVTKENFISVCQQLLGKGVDSAEVSILSALSQQHRVFVHTSPDGLSKELYKLFIALDRKGEAGRLLFSSLERIFYNAAVVPWQDPRFMQKITESRDSVMDTLWYFSSPLQGSEFDQSVLQSNENANVHWWIKKLVQKGKHLGIDGLPQPTAALPSTHEFRQAYLALKFFDYYVALAAQSGDIFALTGFLKQQLYSQEFRLNHPATREKIAQKALSTELAFILPSIQSKLELFCPAYGEKI